MLRIGIIGASNIAKLVIIEPAKQIDDIEVYGIAARDKQKAQKYANENQIPFVFDDYNELLNCDEIDLIYISLPNNLHEKWALAALNAKKHVLIEKPAAENELSALKMVKCAADNERKFFEAFHYFHHPMFQKIIEITKQNDFGEIEWIEAKLDVPLSIDEFPTRWNKALGGGVMMDIGCYPVHWFRNILGEFEVINTRIQYAKTQVDEKVETHLEFNNGAKGLIDVSMIDHKGPRFSLLHIKSKNGELHARNIVLPHFGHELKWRIGNEWFESFKSENTTYFYQLNAIKSAILNGEKNICQDKDIINNIASIEKIISCAAIK